MGKQKRSKPRTSDRGTGPASDAFWRRKLREPGLVAVLLAVATFVAFSPVAQNEFVNYDDPDYVTSNSHVQQGLSWTNVRWAFTTGHASNWHPLTWISHTLDCQVFGQSARGPHLVSVVLHVANTVLLFLVLRSMTQAHWRSAFVAALFGLHPLHVESVAWISERKDVLSSFFFLLMLAAYARYASTRSSSSTSMKVSETTSSRSSTIHSLGWYALALGLFSAGLMSKPMLVTTPFLLLLLDWWPLNRCEADGELIAGRVRRWCRLVTEKVPFFLLAGASSIATYFVQQKGGAVSTSLTAGARVANALISYVRYIGKFLWPEYLSVLYPHPGQWPAWQVVGCGVLLLAILGAVLWLTFARGRNYAAVGWLWFVGSLVPVIGLVQVGIQCMADRYAYIPTIGLFLMVAWGMTDLVAWRRWPVEPFGIGAVAALAACAGVTVRQVQYWHDSEALFRRAVQVTPRNYLAYNNLGFYLSGRGRISEALENYQKAVEINPRYEDALNNIGYALAVLKRHAEAIPYYEAALRIRPKQIEVHNNLGNALSELGRINEAIEHYQFVLKEKPEHADAHNNLGIALAMQGKLEEAVSHFRAALRFKPNYANAHSNLGNALAVQRQFPEAVREYEESLRLNPADPQAHNNLANALGEQGRLAEAVEHYTRAIELNANNPEAHGNLGLLLMRQGKREEALLHLREALKLRPDSQELKRQIEALTSPR